MKTENLSIRITVETKQALMNAVKEFNIKNNTQLSVNAYVAKIINEGLNK